METVVTEKVTVSDQVFGDMKERIFAGEWKPGGKLPSEAELCKIYNVSRTSVRQSLKKLNALGLVETRFGAGSYVKDVQYNDNLNSLIPIVYLENNLNDVFEFRQIIEIECARLAARRARRKDIDELKLIQEKMQQTVREEWKEEFCRLDLEFHYKIAKITGNSMVIKTYDILKEALSYAMQKTIDKMGFVGLEYHENIIKAIEARDEEEAVYMMKKHIKNNYKYFN